MIYEIKGILKYFQNIDEKNTKINKPEEYLKKNFMYDLYTNGDKKEKFQIINKIFKSINNINKINKLIFNDN